MRALGSAANCCRMLAVAGAFAIAIMSPELSLFAHAAAQTSAVGQATAPQPIWSADFDAAEAAVRTGRYKDALIIVKRWEGHRDVPSDIQTIVHDQIMWAAVKVRDYDTATAVNDRMLVAKEGPRDTSLELCAVLAMLQNRIARARECASLYDAE
jgi:hypothetical protein